MLILTKKNQKKKKTQLADQSPVNFGGKDREGKVVRGSTPGFVYYQLACMEFLVIMRETQLDTKFLWRMDYPRDNLFFLLFTGRADLMTILWSRIKAT